MMLLHAKDTTSLSSDQLSAIKKAVATPAPATYLLVKEDFTGDFDSIPGNINKFMSDIKEQKLDTPLEKTKPTAVLIYKENPDEKKPFGYSVGLTVPATAKVKVEPPLSVHTLRYTSAVKVTHTGTNYQELGAMYKNIVDLQTQKGPSQAPKFPVVLELLNDPARTPNGQVLERLVVPVGSISEK
jgi:predicted transcriptional regulator YdeE